MAYNLVITERADEQTDSLAGYLVNDLKNTGAFLHFLNEIDSVYDRLEENPYQFPKSTDSYLNYRGYREALLSEMSYRIVFRIEMQTVYIVGIFHDLEDYVNKVEM